MTRKFVLLAALVLLAAAGAVAAVCQVGGGGSVAPPGELSFCSWAYWQEEGGSDTSRSEIFRNFGLFFVAVIALGFGIWRAWTAHRQAEASQRQAEAASEQAEAANKQAATAEQGHITERFSRAVEQLGHDRVAVRIGGLYALKRIAEDSVERDHLAVMDVITNFIRQPPYTNEQRVAAERDKALRAYKAATPANRPEEPPPESELIDCPDIVAAIEIINGRSEDQKEVEDKRKYRLSLSRASLSYLRLPEVGLHIFDLAGANLTGTDLTGARLTGANLWGANLTNADLSLANLTDANLTRANLTDANLTLAYLSLANLTDANLSNADLWRANLTLADLMGADLTGADLTNADLTNAKHLEQEQLDSACISEGGEGDEPPALPDELNPPQKVCGE